MLPVYLYCIWRKPEILSTLIALWFLYPIYNGTCFYWRQTNLRLLHTSDFALGLANLSWFLYISHYKLYFICSADLIHRGKQVRFDAGEWRCLRVAYCPNLTNTQIPYLWITVYIFMLLCNDIKGITLLIITVYSSINKCVRQCRAMWFQIFQ